jgi:hypothetical protein
MTMFNPFGTRVNPDLSLAGRAAYNLSIRFIPLVVSTPGARASRRKFGCPLFLQAR